MGALLATGDIFLFDGFRLDRRGGGLFRGDERGVFAPLAIGSRALDVLGVLVERPGDLVSRDEIMSAVWPETVVEDSNLAVQIRALRRVLDQGRAEGSCIQTVAGRGYRLVATVTRRAADVGSNTAAAVLTSGAPPRCAAPVDRGAALYQPRRRPGPGIFRRRHHRRSDDRSVADLGKLRDLPQHRLYLQGQSSRREADRPRARRALCAGREHPALGQPGARECAARQC